MRDLIVVSYPSPGRYRDRENFLQSKDHRASCHGFPDKHRRWLCSRQRAAFGSRGEASGTARNTSLTVIHVVVGFRPGYPEVSDRNLSFRAIKETGRFAESDKNANIHPAVAPRVGEAVVTKHRVGAFSGTDLEMLLRARNID